MLKRYSLFSFLFCF